MSNKLYTRDVFKAVQPVTKLPAFIESEDPNSTLDPIPSQMFPAQNFRPASLRYEHLYPRIYA
jgi:hypothetical protein